MSHYSGNKALFVSRVDSPEKFCFSSALEVFKSIYGSDVVIVFVCV